MHQLQKILFSNSSEKSTSQQENTLHNNHKSGINTPLSKIPVLPPNHPPRRSGPLPHLAVLVRVLARTHMAVPALVIVHRGVDVLDGALQDGVSGQREARAWRGEIFPANQRPGRR